MSSQQQQQQQEPKSNPKATKQNTRSPSISTRLAMVELKQKILTSLLKLSDRDTHQIAIEDLRTTIQNLSPEAFLMLLNFLYDAVSSDPKPSTCKDSLRLLTFTCPAHPVSSSAHLTKIIGHDINSASWTPTPPSATHVATSLARSPTSKK